LADVTENSTVTDDDSVLVAQQWLMHNQFSLHFDSFNINVPDQNLEDVQSRGISSQQLSK